MLEQRVQDRTRELTTLLEISQNVASTLELKPLLSVILTQLKGVINFSSAAIYTMEDNSLSLLYYQGPLEDEEVRQIPFDWSQSPAHREVLDSREPRVIKDILDNEGLSRTLRTWMNENLGLAFNYGRSFVGLPLLVKERLVGMLALSSDEPDCFSEQDVRLALSIASQAAAAIENAKLYTEAQESARRTGALAQIASSMALTDSLASNLDSLARSVVEATEAVAASVVLLSENSTTLSVDGSYGLPEGYLQGIEAAWRQGAKSPILNAFASQQVQRIYDLRTRVLADPLYGPVHDSVREAPWEGAIVVPLVYGGRVLGALNTYYLPGIKPNEAEINFLLAIADQASVAAEKARLFEEAQGKAALEERQRLARELHDSVSQAIFSIALHARTARALLGRDPSRAIEPVEHIFSLSQAAMAEMRALIFELRPESLENEGLVAALVKQAAALRARHAVEVNTSLCEEPSIPIELKEVLYRIGQEAAHNTVKHARATHIDILMICTGERITLQVIDDGIGFDTSGQFPGHLGLQSMRERVARAGGTLLIESLPGKGTTVTASIPVPSSESPE